jgi:hypothetical protein
VLITLWNKKSYVHLLKIRFFVLYVCVSKLGGVFVDTSFFMLLILARRHDQGDLQKNLPKKIWVESKIDLPLYQPKNIHIWATLIIGTTQVNQTTQTE